jgi:hypothetical protein
MTRSEYQELMDFLGRQFAAVNGRLTRVEVGVEENRYHIQIVAEGLAAAREDSAREFTAVRKEMGEGFASVWSELGNVRKEMAQGFQAQGKLIRGLGARVDRWEGHRA